MILKKNFIFHKLILCLVIVMVIIGTAVLLGNFERQASAETNGNEPPLTVTIVQPVNGGMTKMATPLIVQTNYPAYCLYNLDSDDFDFDIAVDLDGPIDGPRRMDYSGGLFHTSNLIDVTPGQHTVYIYCEQALNGLFEVQALTNSSFQASATWTKFDTDRTVLYGVDGAGNMPGVLWKLDSETGSKVQEIGPVGDYFVTGLAQDPVSGKLYATTGNRYPEGSEDTSKSLLTIDVNTGQATLVGKIREEGVVPVFRAAVDNGENGLYTYHNLPDIAFNSSGELYGWSMVNQSLYKVDKNTGIATRVGGPLGEVWGLGTDFDSNNNLYVLPDGALIGGDSLVKVDPTTGALEEDYPMPLFFYENIDAFGAASFDPTNMFFAQGFSEGWGSLMVVDLSTGIIVDLGSSMTMTAPNGHPDMTFMNAIAFYTTTPSGGMTVPIVSGPSGQEEPETLTEPDSGEGDEDGLPENVEVGMLVKLVDGSTIYFIGADEQRHAFPNEYTYLSWFADYDDIVVLSEAQMSAIPLGDNVTIREGTYLVKLTSSPEVYAIEPDGLLRWLETEDLAVTLYGNDWGDRLIDLPDAFFSDYTVGDSITEAVHPTGSLLSYAGETDAYYINEGEKQLVGLELLTEMFQTVFLISDVPTSLTYPTGSLLPAMTMADLIP